MVLAKRNPQEESMDETYFVRIASELNLNAPQVQAAAGLLDEGGSVPFIARYRKEVTDGLDEVAVTAIRDRLCRR